MAEDFNNINRPAGGSMPDPNRPRLKKVKRPIKRIVNPSNAAGVSAAMPPKPNRFISRRLNSRHSLRQTILTLTQFWMGEKICRH